MNVPHTLSFQRRTLNYSGRGRVTGSHAYLDLTRGKALELLAINGDSRAISAHQPETCCSDAVSTRTVTKTTSAISSATKPTHGQATRSLAGFIRPGRLKASCKVHFPRGNNPVGARLNYSVNTQDHPNVFRRCELCWCDLWVR
jgi:hypothetical protein